MRYDAEHKARTRQAVLKEASRAIRAAGPVNVSVAAVMARAGLTHGGFYAHFESRDALLAASVEAAFADSALRLERAGGGGGADPRAALASYVTAYLAAGHVPERARGCPLAALATDMPRLNEDAREHFAAGLGRIAARLASLLEEAGIAEPQVAAASALAEMVGALALARAVPGGAQAGAILDGSRRALLYRFGLKEFIT